LKTSANFYRLRAGKELPEVFKLPGELLAGGKSYRIRVCPVETFGKKGAPIETILPIPPGRKALAVQAAYPQE